MEKKKRKASGKVIAIAVMLVLCVAAAAYILKIAGGRTAYEPPEADVTDIEQEPEADEAVADEEMKAKLAHIYTAAGTSSEEKYTMEAFDSAVGGGSVCLSMPVVAAGDGTLYVADDDNLYDMTGVNGYLSGMTESQLADVKTKGGSSLVRLSDVFEKYGTDISYVIEIKYPNDRNIMAFAETVKKAGTADVTSVSSYYFDALERAENEFPDMPKIFLSEEDGDFSEARGRDVVDTISVKKEMMDEEHLSEARDSGKKFGAWMLSSEDEIRKAVELGIDSYFTDEGALAVSIEKGTE